MENFEGVLLEVMPEDTIDVAWMKLNKKAIIYIEMAISNEILVDLEGLIVAFELWEKLKATYEVITLVNHVHLLPKLDVCNLSWAVIYLYR